MQFNVMGLLCPGSCRAAFFKHSTLVFAMRVSFVYVLMGLCSMTLLFAEEVKSQSLDSLRVTVEMNNEPLSRLFEKIQNQTGLLFAFRQAELERVQPITIAKQTTTVKQILELAFTNTELQYKQVNYSVVVFEKRAEPLTEEVKESITGVVKDKSGSPLPGVSIFIKGTTTGTTSAADGTYAIDAKLGDVLVFSFIGQKTFETVVDARTVIDVVMEEDVNTLQEVVINGGYYETTDRLKTGNIAKVTSKDIENQPVTSPLMALQGRVAGLEVTPSTGLAGAAPRIRLRGTNSLRTQNGNAPNSDDNGNYPLYVIDGVQIVSQPLKSYSSGFAVEGFDPLSTINPANIESIEVLKDGDATAMYGSRGANGVILITTKRNRKASEQTNIDINIYRGVGQIMNRLDLMNTDQYVAMRKEGMANDGSVPGQEDYDITEWDTTRYTDWQEVLLGGTSNVTDINVGISSGTKNTSFRFNGGYHKETMIFPGDFGYQRVNGQLSINHISANRKFRMDISSTYGVDMNHFFEGNTMMTRAISLPPNAPKVRLPDGSLNWQTREINGEQVATWTNPLSFLIKTHDMNSQSLVNSAALSYELINDLTLSTNFGYTILGNDEMTISPLSSVPPHERKYYISGGSGFTDNKRKSWIIEPKISYTKTIGYHSVSAFLGTTLQNTTSHTRIIQASEYPSDAMLKSLKGAGIIDIIRDEETQYKYTSAYFRIGYNWRERYLVNVTGRRDGSSRFGPGKRFGNFGAIGVAWIFSNESFLQKSKFITLGKLRASYGTTGNDQIADYAYYNLYEPVGSPGGLNGVAPYSLLNPDLRWEITNKLEGALELAFFENRFSTSVSWYRNRSSNQLVAYPLSAITGFESVYANFDALVENSGWEILLSGDILSSDSWRWLVAVNLSIPRNKLVRFDGIEDSPYADAYKVGEPLSVQWLYTYKGVNPETGFYEVVDKNNDGIIGELDKSLFNLNPRPYFGGINSTIQYKNFELSFLLSFSHQTLQRYRAAGNPGSPYMNQPTWMLQRWRETGDRTDIQRFSDNDGNNSYDWANASNHSVVNASYIRLKTLSIGYRFPVEWLERIKIQQAKIFIQGQNIFTITKYRKVGIDPETGNSLPPLSIISAGLQLRI